MRLKLTWPGNADGDIYPIPALKPVMVGVSVVDEPTGKPAIEPYYVTVSLDSRPLTVERIDGNAAEYLIPTPRGRHFFPVLIVTATPVVDGPALSLRVRVVGPALQNVAAVARFIVGLAAMYVCILIPNIQDALKVFNEIPALPVLGAGALLLGWWRHWVARLIRHPIVMTSAALGAMLLIGILFSQRRLVVNESLDSIALPDGGQLKPGGYAITSVSEKLLGDARCVLAGMPDRIPLTTEPPAPSSEDCVRFASPPNVGLVLASLLLLKRVNIGCIDRHPASLPLGTPIGPWSKARSCQPSELLLEGQRAKDAIGNYDESRGRAERVTTHLLWGPERQRRPAQLHWEDANDLLSLSLEPWPLPHGQTSSARSSNLLGLVFRRAEPKLTLETTIDLSDPAAQKLLTTVPNKEGGIVDAQIRVGQTVTGEFSARLAAGTQPRCWAATSGERLQELLFRDSTGQSYSRFRASLPEVVGNVPACRTGAERPSFAELHLDPSWMASEGWALELPGQLSPERLTILDPSGHAWGELRCPAVADDARFTIGPVSLDQMRPELTALTASAAEPGGHGANSMKWNADPSHAADLWAWACWIGDQPPRTLRGKGLWSAALPPSPSDRSNPGRSYKLTHGLRICCMESNRTTHVGPCEKPPNAESIAWYSAQGPDDCDTHLSRLAP